MSDRQPMNETDDSMKHLEMQGVDDEDEDETRMSWLTGGR